MIAPSYVPRESEELTGYIKRFQNALQLRDWAFDLDFGDCIPEEFDTEDEAGAVLLDEGMLTAFIWVCPLRCARENKDPLYILAHEMCHAFLGSQNEEVRVNVVAGLLLAQCAKEPDSVPDSPPDG